MDRTFEETRRARALHERIPEPTVDQVREATAAWFADESNHGYGGRWAITWAVARAFEEKQMRVQDFQGALSPRFHGQVQRTLDAMARDGRLVKNPGEGSHGEAGYYTTEAWAAKVAADKARAEEHRQTTSRWVAVQGYLKDRGLRLKTGGALSLEDWEKLIGDLG